MKLSFQPLTPERWPDLEALFMAKGCSIARGCWCMYYRESGRQSVPAGQTLQALRKQCLQTLAGAEPPAGILAYHGARPVGWLSFGPRSDYKKLQRSPVMKPVDDQPVWSV
ncbi:MAG TPA: GNAT family N-acetyltransferase, partial [Rubrivivax sp.]|nr:GNAT family N-acetyltransferase [Rubrivivax sp.]